MGYRIADIAQQFDLELCGDPEVVVEGLCGLSDNLPACLSFVTSAAHLAAATHSRIPAFVTRPGLRVDAKINLLHDDPDYAMARVAGLFTRSLLTQDEPVHATAVVEPTAALGPGCRLGAHVVVGAHARIGAHTRIMPGSVIGDRVVIGSDCLIHANCVIREDCVLQDRVILQPGVIVGGDGFGYVHHDGHHVKVPQLGRVLIESDVEIGANSAIDRGRFTDTRIGAGTKIDDCVMVAHNVRVGEHCLLVAQTGISGSTRIGDRVRLAGQVGIVGHLHIADGVTVLGQSMVCKDIGEPGSTWGGSPARPATVWRRAIARLYAGLHRV